MHLFGNTDIDNTNDSDKSDIDFKRLQSIRTDTIINESKSYIITHGYMIQSGTWVFIHTGDEAHGGVELGIVQQIAFNNQPSLSVKYLKWSKLIQKKISTIINSMLYRGNSC